MPLVGTSLALLFQCGCASVPVGDSPAGGVGYHPAKGELQSKVTAPMDRVWWASLYMVDEMEYGTSRRRKDSARAEICALTARSTPIEIQLKSVSEQTTRIRIRVGTSGSEKLSRLLLEKITKRL